MKQILGKLRKAVEDFNMIQDGDRIAVGLSGGKDSTLLLYALKRYQRFAPCKFEICAVTVNMGLEGYDPSPLIEFCGEIDVPYTIIDTQIGEIIFNVRKEHSPCSLCANMRRGALHNKAKELKCNKVALGHHANDAIETLMLSMFYEGRISTFSPVTFLDDKNLYLIRPFVYIEEGDIIGASRREGIPVIKNPCPANGHTKRQYMKELIKDIQREIPDVRERMLGSIMNTQQLNIWDKKAISGIGKREG
jgi:tRNA(Ile)-lysidine synthase TilS/MesJ